MFDDFIVRAVVAGVGVALVSGALGCFVVWRRMAYFGDSLAHSALLGVALGLLYQINVSLSIMAVSSAFAVLLVYLQHRQFLATDTLLGILAHSALSVAIVAISLLEGVNVDLFAYLFGDILSITERDIYWVYGGGAVVLTLLAMNWSSLVLMTVSEDMACAEGVAIFRMKLLLVALMAIVVSVSIQIVGILLIASLLIIPAATARQFASSPRAMAFISVGLGVLAVALGMTGSVWFDVPSGPSIVIAAAVSFVVLFVAAQMVRCVRGRG